MPPGVLPGRVGGGATRGGWGALGRKFCFGCGLVRSLTRVAVSAQCVEGINYMAVKKSGMYLCITSRYNLSPCMILELLERLTRLIKDYCGMINEDSVRRNFVLIYELLDEIMDYGYPQATATEQVKVYIFNTPAMVADNPIDFVAQKLEQAGLSLKSKTSVDASAVRKPVGVGVAKGQNEVFLDVLERVTITFDNQADVPRIVNSEINGSILLKSYLQGSPEIQLALNEDLVIGSKGSAGYGRVCLDDVNFHESCRVDQFERERVLLVHPPDGEVTLMNYRIADNFAPPFKLFPFIDEQSANRIEVTIKVKGEFRDPHFGSNVCVRIPLPEKLGSVSAQLPVDAVGESTEYKGPEKCMYWFIKKFPAQSEHSMRTKIVLDSKADISACSREIGPMSLIFEIPMFNCSGLAVKYLRVNESGRDTKPNRWVRYITQSASYVVRC
jgi:AP-4 complex subunit mu-1|eukprot:COSAG01_NODE_5507_length_4215_cov_2.694363_4_plen_443_part_00